MAIKYCTHNAGGSGDGTSISSPWTLAQMLAGLTNADVGYVCNTGTYALTGATRSFTNAGTDQFPLVVIGRSADGSADAVATIDGSGMDATTDILYQNATNAILLKNIRITAARRYGINQGSTGTIEFRLINCQVDSCVNYGIYSNGSTGAFWLNRCRVNNNAGGFFVSAAQRGKLVAFDSVFDHNTSHGVYDSAPSSVSYARPTFVNCLFYRNGGDGLRIFSAAYAGIHVYNNTFFANTGDGINIVGTNGQICINHNIFRSNGAYGIRLNSSTIDQLVDCVGNCSNNNTSGHIDINSGVLPGSGHVLENPEFVDETDGIEDLMPTNPNMRKSYAYQTGGTKYFWIGAIQPAFTIYSSTGGSGGGATAAEVADAVCDELLSGHTTAGSLAKVLSDSATATAVAALPTASSIVTAIEAAVVPVDVTHINGVVATLQTDLAKTTDIPTAAAIATAVWSATTRTLSSFGTLAADTATAVWSATTRVLTAATNLSIPTASDVATAVWASTTRTLSSFGTLVSDIRAAIWSGVRRLTNAAGVEYDGALESSVASVKSDTGAVRTNVDVAVSSRASGTDATTIRNDIAAVKAETTSTKTVTDTIAPLISNGAFTSESMVNVTTSDPNTAAIKVVTDKMDKMIVADGVEDYKFDTNALEEAPVGGNAGTGAYDYIISPILDNAANPMAGVLVRVYSDANCRTLVGSNITGADGRCLFHLDAGDYWQWADKDGYGFNNPYKFTVEVPVP